MKKSASSARQGNVTRWTGRVPWGRAEKKEEGREQEAKRISALTARLLKEKRLEDLQRTTEDEKYREKLLKEYGIE